MRIPVITPGLALYASVPASLSYSYRRRDDSPCDSDDPSDNAPTCPISSTALARQTSLAAKSSASLASEASKSSLGTNTITSPTSTGKHESTGTASATSSSSAAAGQGSKVHWGGIVGGLFAAFVGVVTAALLVRAWRRRSREKQDEAALAAATAAALGMGARGGEKPPGVTMIETTRPSNNRRSRSRSPMLDTSSEGPQEEWDEARPLTTSVPNALNPGYNYYSPTSPTSPHDPTSRDNPASATALLALGLPARRTHMPARANTYSQSVISLPNPFDVGAVGRSHTLPPVPSTMPRARGVEAEMDDAPAVPPKPAQWLSRSPVNSAYIPAEAEASGSAAQEGAGLFAEMTGHQKQMEADAEAEAGRATGGGGLQRASEAPPRYSLD